jgi:SAM-dependent methyltransferase
VLTVDFDRLGLGPGRRLLDLGCGGGRHAFEAARTGATVVALDHDGDETAAVACMFGAMRLAGELPPSAAAGVLRGEALALPFADATFDVVIAAEVLEHLPDDGAAVGELARVLKPYGCLAVSVPRWGPERLCWALAEDYHAPAVPGGHLRIYRRGDIHRLLEGAGLRVGARHHAHSLHTPYWWLRCALGVRREDAWGVRHYHRFLVWDLTARPRAVRLLERALDPVMGKSLVLYAQKSPPGAGG